MRYPKSHKIALWSLGIFAAIFVGVLGLAGLLGSGAI